MTDLVLITRAYAFAARYHAKQRRLGAVADPYVNHLCEVAELVAEVAPDDAALIAAAVLHDTLEDTKAKYEDLLWEFGRDVARLVLEVTDDRSLTKAERKRKQVEKALTLSPRAKILKLCDKASNVTSIAVTPPDWPLKKRREYLRWAEEVADAMGPTDLIARAFFDQAVSLCRETLDDLEADQ